MPSARDEAFMQAALALARRGLGRTAPNPSVAALIVDENRTPPVVLGRGVTAPGGRPHAEAIALEQAGEAARGVTLYVTLEPCSRRSTQGFGLSCTDHILESGIARVVIGGTDASPLAAGEGAARLRAAGITVEEGVLADEAGQLNIGHATRMRLGRPFIQVKLARTPDGFAGTADRRPLAITGEEARAFVHRLRASADALVTGIGTVLADDPLLDCRLPGMAEYSPLRVVLDSHARLPATCRLVKDAARMPVLVATAEPEALQSPIGQPAGLDILAVPKAGHHLDLHALFAALSARGITRVMIEAGPELANAIAVAGLCDELVLLTGSNPVGQGLLAIGPALAKWIEAADITEERQIGADTMVRYASDRRI